MTKRRRQGSVGAGADGQPFLRMGRHLLPHAHVHPHDARTVLARLGYVVHAAAAVDARRSGAGAKQDDQVGVLHDGGGTTFIGGAPIEIPVQHVARSGIGLAFGIGPVGAQHAAVQVHESDECAAAVVDSERAVLQNGLVAIGVDDVLEFVGEDVGGFVPADFLELAFAALADAFQRPLQTVRMVDPVTDRATAQAGAVFQSPEFVAPRSVAFDVGDHTVFHMELKRALSHAAAGAGVPDDFVFCRRLFRHRLCRFVKRGRAADGCSNSGQGTPLTERASRKRPRSFHSFFHSFLLS